MLSNKEREGLILQQYWYIVAVALLGILHYFALGFNHLHPLIPADFLQPLVNTHQFIIDKVSWLLNPWYIFTMLVIGISFYGLGARGVKSTEITAEQVRSLLIIGLLMLVSA